jgi:hypothetical protein
VHFSGAAHLTIRSIWHRPISMLGSRIDLDPSADHGPARPWRPLRIELESRTSPGATGGQTSAGRGAPCSAVRTGTNRSRTWRTKIGVTGFSCLVVGQRLEAYRLRPRGSASKHVASMMGARGPMMSILEADKSHPRRICLKVSSRCERSSARFVSDEFFARVI